MNLYLNNLNTYINKLILIFFFYGLHYFLNNQLHRIINNYFKSSKDKQSLERIISENFFIIDSTYLDNVKSHLYGFTVSKKGIFTDNYYQQIGGYINPDPNGAYVMVRNNDNEIIINQDFQGSFGLYIYQNIQKDYFILSNSFLLLEEYLIGKQNISMNKDYADYLIISHLCSFSIDETLIKEISIVPSNAYITIDKKKKKFRLNYIDYKENTIPLESEKGSKLIDKWVDKWCYILRSLKNQTDNLSADLSGGFDTRMVLSILLNSGINLNDILIHSTNDKEHDHDIDFQIATNISSKLGFKLNNFKMDNNFSKFSIKDSLIKTFYTKLGFHKEMSFGNIFYTKPRFAFTGGGGETIRGHPGEPITSYIKKMSSSIKILGHEEEFFNSSMRILNRSVFLLKNERKFNNEYETSLFFYSKANRRNHFGKAALEGFLSNFYILQPLMDPDLYKIKFEVNRNSSHDLVAYIYIRLAIELINFPFQGNRTLDLESIKKAKILNNKILPYKIKSNYNKNYYIDNKRKFQRLVSREEKTAYDLIKDFFHSSKYNLFPNNYNHNTIYI